jgi:PKD repeat protein
MKQQLSILILAAILLTIGAKNVEAQMVGMPIPGSDQPEMHLDKVESQGWIELSNERKLFSSQYMASDGKRISFSSSQLVNYPDDKGNLRPVDIRPKYNGSGWGALQQPEPLEVLADASFRFTSREKESMLFSAALRVDGETANSSISGVQDRQHIWFYDIADGIDKQMEFRMGAMKYNYIIRNTPPEGDSHWVIEEMVELGNGVQLVHHPEAGSPLEPEYTVERGNEILAGIHPIVVVDQAGEVLRGKYEWTNLGNGRYIQRMKIDRDWLRDPARQYPVVVDPLITGNTAMFPMMYIPSCFFPTYSADSMLVEIPGGITVTALNVMSNYYANPFTTTVMADGRMFFGSECDDTNTFQVQGEEGQLGGTAYLENYNMNNPILCCKPQQCAPFSIYFSKHLSRTTNGNLCDTFYLYYDPFSLWPFSAYAEGYTPELYGLEMNFSPNTVCSDDCDVDARIFVRYGVPPFEFTHPWSQDAISWGNPLGCSVGSANRELVLDLPNCPYYCEDGTILQVPPPVVTDQCGIVAIYSQEFYELPIEPTPIAYASTDVINLCSGESFDFSWEACLPGSLISWSEGGNTGSGENVNGSYSNDGTTPEAYTFYSSATLGDCTGLPDSVQVNVYPIANIDFSATPSPAVAGNTVSFEDLSNFNGNNSTGFFWTFGDDFVSDDANPTHIYDEPGIYEVCLMAETQFGCSELFCKEITIVPAELVLPNILSANGDNVNDSLAIQYLDQFESNRIEVFNRWGNPVFVKDNYQGDWKAEGLSEGVYYYTVVVNGREPYKQVLQIVR